MAWYKQAFSGSRFVEAESLEEAIEAFENDDADFEEMTNEPVEEVNEEEVDEAMIIPMFEEDNDDENP